MTGPFNSFDYVSFHPRDPEDWRNWLFGLARGLHDLGDENTRRAQAIIAHIQSLEVDLEHQSNRRKYWKKRAEKAAGIVRDIASSGCGCAEAALCDQCGKPLVDCEGGEL